MAGRGSRRSVPDVTTILIGVDDSTHSEDAVAFGRRLAGITGSRIVLSSAFPYSDIPSRAANLTYRAALNEQATLTVNRMRRLLELPDERVETVVAANLSPAKALHELAEKIGAALVVVGHSRHGTAGRIVPGQTAERLLHGAPCPVAVVPEGYRLRKPETVRRVGVAYVDTPEARAALTAAAALARGFHAALEVIGVVTDDVPAAMLGGLHAGDDARADVADHVLAELEHVVGALRTETWAEAIRLSGEPSEQLAEHSVRLDLLVMGSRGYGPLRAVLAGGVSGRVAREAHCPVIVVPRGVDAPLGSLFGTAALAG